TGTTPIAATVFIPEHRAGEKYPLIVHSHGWGGSRATAANAVPDDDPAADFFDRVDRQVFELWTRGYGVISFDERGWGQSGGQVRSMDPMFETRDAIAVVDWAVANMDVAKDANGDPLIGAIGGSYGGGFQLLLAALDPRIDAITPAATWNDLEQSVVPNGVILKGFAGGLCILAAATGARLDPAVEQSCQEGYYTLSNRFVEQITPSVIEFLAAHGLGAFERDPGFVMRPVDALFVHGPRDVLFNFNQALANYRYLQAAGGDVRILTTQGSHILGAPFSSQQPQGPANCGAIDGMASIRAWLDAKLRGNTQAIAGIPEICMSLDNDQGVNLDAVPFGSAAYTVTLPATSVTGSNRNTPDDTAVFIPLGAPISGDGRVLAGVPTADLDVQPTV
ncbi:MAG: alpha/beta fold hydrolase, partial [Dongiaceae bacterium]